MAYCCVLPHVAKLGPPRGSVAGASMRRSHQRSKRPWWEVGGRGGARETSGQKREAGRQAGEEGVVQGEARKQVQRETVTAKTDNGQQVV